MLLEAIAKLESAMRDNGHVIEAANPLDSLAALKEAIGQARSDIAHMPGYGKGATELPLKRFSFDTIPAVLARETQAVRDAAANIQSAAYALQAAGVFQGVARQIAERAEDIEQACATQEAAVNRAGRMATLLSEIEAELMTVFEDEASTERFFKGGDASEELHPLYEPFDDDREIPDMVMEELSAVLADGPMSDDYGGPYRR
jgi:hypothetical protein